MRGNRPYESRGVGQLISAPACALTGINASLGALDHIPYCYGKPNFFDAVVVTLQAEAASLEPGSQVQMQLSWRLRG
jgi:hypothetical protein